jgi:N6-L-threonylcarbamoyladenine synthase
LAQAKHGQDSRVPAVYVLNQRGQPLMPTTPRKARVLLAQGKAEVKTRTPFTIQLTVATGETTQPITLGVDPGYKYVGLSAVTEKRELYCAEAVLRTDMVDLLSARRAYRKNRRGRNLRYRQPRFLNRTKPKGWLAPSVQYRLNSHVNLIARVKKILPVINVRVETAAFDIQKIKNPEIQGKEYQQGPQLGYYNVREYCLDRDNHTCRHCKGKSKDKVLNLHHLESRKTGGDRPENLVTLCLTCHHGYHAGTVKLKLKPSKGFKAETFMALIKTKLVVQLDCEACFGYETKFHRHYLGLDKSHKNDAFVIAGGREQPRVPVIEIKRVRKQNRKLFRGPHSGTRNTATRFVHGFQRYDKVMYRGQECFVFARRTRGTLDLRFFNGVKINGDAKASTCKLLESSSTWLTSAQER